MAEATVKLVNSDNMIDFYINRDQMAVAQRLLREGAYTQVGSMGVPDFEGEDVAEELFDLTNNPGREEERLALYPTRYRSISVGDIVRVDGVNFLCCSMGWRKITD